MNNSPLTLPTDRLVDYFCVCGPGDELVVATDATDYDATAAEDGASGAGGRPHPLQVAFTPQLLARYPMVDGALAFPTGVPSLCFPSSCRLHASPLVPISSGGPAFAEEPLPAFFVFVATGSKHEHVFGHVLLFWERATDAQLAQLDMEALGRTTALTSPPLTPKSSSFAMTGAGVAIDSTLVADGSVVASSAAPTDGGSAATAPAPAPAPAPTPAPAPAAAAAAAAAAAPAFALFVPKAFCVLSRWNFPAFRAVLTELYRLSLSPATLPLERIVCNFVSEVPLPPAGKVEVQYTIGSAAVSFRRPPKNRRVSAVGMPFREVFECLDLPNILTLFRCVLLERQILLVSSQLTLLTAAAEVLVSLIYPFRWTHMYSPILPAGLIDALQAPFPFIVGLHRRDYDNVRDSLPPEVVVVLLDKNAILTDPAVTVPHLPVHQRKKLVDTLARVADVFSGRGANWALVRLPNYDSAFDFAARPDDVEDAPEAAAAEDEDAFANSDEDERRAAGREGGGGGGGGGGAASAGFGLVGLGGYRSGASRRSGVHVNWHATRRAFFRLFVSLLLRYREFLVYPSADNPAPRSRFDKKGFLDTAKPDARPLLEALMTTQAFANFVDDRIQPEASNNVDVEFFDQSIDEKKNRSIMSMFSKRDTPFLTTREFAITKTVLAPAPEVSDLPEEGTVVYRYTPFPQLQPTLYVKPRAIPSFADTAAPGSAEALRLRRAALFDMFGAGRRGSTAATASAWAALSSNTTEQNVYTAWFLAFVAALDVVADEVSRRAAEEYDATEAAATAAAERVAARARAVASDASPPLSAASSPASPPTGPAGSSAGSSSAAVRSGGQRAGSVAAALSAAAPPPEARSPPTAPAPLFRAGSVASALAAGGSASSATAAATATAAAAGGAGAPNGAPSPPTTAYLLPAKYGPGGGGGGPGGGAGRGGGGSSSSIVEGSDGVNSSVLNNVRVVSSAPDAAAAARLSSGAAAHSGAAPGSGLGSPGSPRAPVRAMPRGAAKGGEAALRAQAREGAIAAARGVFLSTQLDAAFTVLERMKVESVQPDELVYRALLEACGRVGNYGKAYQVLAEMQAAGMATDASLYRTLFQAFFHANPDATAAGATLPVGALHFQRGRIVAPRGGLPPLPPPPSGAATARGGGLSAASRVLSPGTEAATAPAPSSSAAAIMSARRLVMGLGVGATTGMGTAAGAMAAAAVTAAGTPTPADAGVGAGGVRRAVPPLAAAVEPSAPDVTARQPSAAPSRTGVPSNGGGGGGGGFNMRSLFFGGGSGASAGGATTAAPATTGTPDVTSPARSAPAISVDAADAVGLASSASAPTSPEMAPASAHATIPPLPLSTAAAGGPPPLPPRRPPKAAGAAPSAPAGGESVAAAVVAARSGTPDVAPTPAAPPAAPPVGALHAPATPSASTSVPAPMGVITVLASIIDRHRPSIHYTAGGIVRGNSGVLDGGGSGSGGFGSHRGSSNFMVAEADVLLPVLHGESPVSAVAGSLALARRFPGLTINTLRERCPDCGADLTDEDIRRGWTRSENDYTTVHVGCKKAEVLVRTMSAAGGGMAASPAPSARRFRGLIEDEGGTVRRFVARFTVSSLARGWKGTMSSGPAAPLHCEYLPPAVLVKELQRSIINGQLGPTLRVRAPTLFWNLVLWSISFALPLEFLTFMAREEKDADEEAALADGVERMLAAAVASPAAAAPPPPAGGDSAAISSARSGTPGLEALVGADSDLMPGGPTTPVAAQLMAGLVTPVAAFARGFFGGGGGTEGGEASVSGAPPSPRAGLPPPAAAPTAVPPAAAPSPAASAPRTWLSALGIGSSVPASSPPAAAAPVPAALPSPAASAAAPPAPAPALAPAAAAVAVTAAAADAPHPDTTAAAPAAAPPVPPATAPATPPPPAHAAGAGVVSRMSTPSRPVGHVEVI